MLKKEGYEYWDVNARPVRVHESGRIEHYEGAGKWVHKPNAQHPEERRMDESSDVTPIRDEADLEEVCSGWDKAAAA